MLKINQKYFCLLSDNFINGDIFGLLFKVICSFISGDMNIIIFLKCGYNKK